MNTISSLTLVLVISLTNLSKTICLPSLDGNSLWNWKWYTKIMTTTVKSYDDEMNKDMTLKIKNHPEPHYHSSENTREMLSSEGDMIPIMIKVWHPVWVVYIYYIPIQNDAWFHLYIYFFSPPVGVSPSFSRECEDDTSSCIRESTLVPIDVRRPEMKRFGPRKSFFLNQFPNFVK